MSLMRRWVLKRIRSAKVYDVDADVEEMREEFLQLILKLSVRKLLSVLSY